VAEIEAIGRVITLAEWTGARVHIAHHSAADSLYLLRAAKARGVDITVETCPQYLLLNTEHMRVLGGILRVNPPIREPRHNQPLWDALMDGTIDMIATDHAPHTPEEKTRDSIWSCDCGFPGVETQMPLMLTEVNRERAR
jgi:dihydroorotase-like cyclic amidohydrolase